MNVKIKVYSSVKYWAMEKVGEVEYNNISGYEVKEISDEEIAEMGYDEVDDFNEYLIITLQNGETATFRNSYVDLFIREI